MFLHVLLCNLYVNISFKKLQHTYIIILMPERNLINSLTLCFFILKLHLKNNSIQFKSFYFPKSLKQFSQFNHSHAFGFRLY